MKVASRTSRTTLLALQVSAEQGVGWMTAMPSSTNPAYCTQIGPQKGGQNFDRRFLSTILDSGTRPYMPGKRATSRVERAFMLLTALKPDRMGAERARLLNKEQRYPFVVTQSVSQSVSQRSEIRFPAYYTPPTKRQKSFALSARVPSFERDRPPGGPPLVTPQLKGRPARRAVNNLRSAHLMHQTTEPNQAQQVQRPCRRPNAHRRAALCAPGSSP